MKFTDIVEADTWVLRIMFSVYMIAGNFILLNLFISVINEGLAFLRENPDKAEYDLELADYITVWSNQNNTHVYRIGTQ